MYLLMVYPSYSSTMIKLLITRKMHLGKFKSGQWAQGSFITICGSYSLLVAKKYMNFIHYLKNTSRWLVPAIRQMCVTLPSSVPPLPFLSAASPPTCTPYIFTFYTKSMCTPQKKYSAFKNIIQNCLRFRK